MGIRAAYLALWEMEQRGRVKKEIVVVGNGVLGRSEAGGGRVVYLLRLEAWKE